MVYKYGELSIYAGLIYIDRSDQHPSVFSIDIVKVKSVDGTVLLARDGPYRARDLLRVATFSSTGISCR